MSMIASDNGGTLIPKLEAGVYTGIASAIIDLGEQKNEKFNKTQRKFILTWNILGEEIEINEKKLPRTISKEYSFSLGEKSNLTKDLQSWRGKSFSVEERQGFNVLTLLNKACQLQINLEEKNNNEYNNIAGIMSLQKGTQIEELKEVYYLDLTDTTTWTNWSKVPSWIQEKIKKAENYNSTGFKAYVDKYEAEKKENTQTASEEDADELVSEDDLPF